MEDDHRYIFCFLHEIVYTVQESFRWRMVTVDDMSANTVAVSNIDDQVVFVWLLITALDDLCEFLDRSNVNRGSKYQKPGPVSHFVRNVPRSHCSRRFICSRGQSADRSQNCWGERDGRPEAGGARAHHPHAR